MPSLWSEVQLTYILIMTVCLGIFRAIDIGLHSRDFHTAQSAHSALTCNASLLEALRNTLGKSFVPGSILNLCLISFPSQVKLEKRSDQNFIPQKKVLVCMQMEYLCWYSYGWNTFFWYSYGRNTYLGNVFIRMEYGWLYSYGWIYLTTPVATSMKHPTKRPVDGGLPDGSLLTFDISFKLI